MPRSMLFGYTVEREDGKVIVTIDGELAGPVMARLTGRRAHRGAAGMPFPFGPLGSPGVSLTSLFAAGATEVEEDAEAAEPDLASIFGQGFDRGYQEYDAKLQAYRDLLATQSDTAEAPFDAGMMSMTIEPSAPTRRRKVKARQKSKS